MENSKQLTGEVIYVTSKERSINYKWDKNYSWLHPGVQIVAIDDIQQMDIGIFDGKRILMDTILAKHPFIPNKYIDINASEDTITKSKLLCLGIIAKNLGVRELETTYASEELQEATYDASGNISYKIVQAEAKTKICELDKATGKYWRQESYTGGFSQETYEKALKSANEFGLYRDEDIFYLLKQRDPNDKNLMTSQNVKIELTRELNSQLEIAFTLKASSIFDLKANYSETISKKKIITIETKLIF